MKCYEIKWLKSQSGQTRHWQDILLTEFFGYLPPILMTDLGPTSAAINDFWRMLWKENCFTIVMLTNLVELGKVSFFLFVVIKAKVCGKC